jgi:hypothetical protein
MEHIEEKPIAVLTLFEGIESFQLEAVDLFLSIHG